MWGQWELSVLSSQFFCKWEPVLKSRIHSRKKRPSREVRAYTAPPWKTTAQSLWSTAWAGWAPCVTWAGHTLPNWQPRLRSQECFPHLEPPCQCSGDNPVSLCTCSGPVLERPLLWCPPRKPPSASSLGRQGVGKSIPPSDPPWTQQASLALTLGTRPGHFDGVSGQSLGQFPSFSARGFIACSSQGFPDLELTI